MIQILEARRNKLRGLIDKATENADPVKIAKGWELLTTVQKLIAAANALNGKFSNLY